MEDSQDRIFPEGDVDYATLAQHPPTNKDGVVAVLAITGNVANISEI